MVSNAGILITWPQLLYLGIVVLSFYLAELLFFWLRHGRKNSTQNNVLQQQVADLRRELDAMRVTVLALAARPLPQELGDEYEDSGLFDLSSSPVNESPYAHAIRLAQTGADAPEVAASCGISRGEADLIVAIYRTERS